MSPRADIVDTGSPWAESARIRIDAPAQAIFDVLADPAMHAVLDGSGTVQGLVAGPQRLSLGAHFGMGMRIRLPYRTNNTVVEFEEGRRIAWCHFYRHRWRYELEPVTDVATIVTETFDGRTSLFPPGLLAINAYANNQVAVAKTLVRLKRLAETGSADDEGAVT
ncbi:MAG: SRPBCC family protein [Actinomycetota bacterium]|nr:SRPBCC family protein [Actinomycetota bacterium]